MNVELAKMHELAYKKELNTLIADECVCGCVATSLKKASI